jgi:hypothetical protein
MQQKFARVDTGWNVFDAWSHVWLSPDTALAFAGAVFAEKERRRQAADRAALTVARSGQAVDYVVKFGPNGWPVPPAQPSWVGQHPFWREGDGHL